MLRETKEQTLSVRVTRLADWLLRIRARYEPMNGFTESAGLLHELLARTESLEAEIESLHKSIDERGETGQLIIWKAQEK